MPDSVPLPGRPAPRHPRRPDAHIGELIICWVLDLRSHALAGSARRCGNRRVGSFLLQCFVFNMIQKGSQLCSRMQER